MTLRLTVLGLCVLGLAIWFPIHSIASPELRDHVKIIQPSNIQWKETTEFPGLKIALVYGDPAKPGLYVMYAKFKPGFMTEPHYHTADRFVTVISGTWWATIGDHETADATTPLTAGSSMLHTAGLVHFDGAKDTSTIVQITGIGPVETIYVFKNEE